MTERCTLTTRDGLRLEAERARPISALTALGATAEIGAAAVLCHPHPQYGGTMRSLVISTLFDALPARGVDCLRFNFRGVEGSEGEYDHGIGERSDVVAAIDALADDLAASVAIYLVGWSFGADMALATHDPRLAGWLGIALPMRFVTDADRAAVAADHRPKLLALAQHDEFRDAQWVMDATGDWANTRREVIAGASHFFVGRTDRLVELADEFLVRR
jgi:alpha/beta superfamily hydrolase